MCELLLWYSFFISDYYINGKKYFKTFCYIFLINCIISKLRKISSLLLLLFWWMFKSLWLVPLFHCFETSYAHQDCIYFIKIHWKQHFYDLFQFLISNFQHHYSSFQYHTILEKSFQYADTMQYYFTTLAFFSSVFEHINVALMSIRDLFKNI